MKKFLSLLCLSLVVSLAYSQVRFVSVDPANSRYTIKNFGSGTVNISNYRLCALFSYTPNLTSLTVESGSLNLASGAEVTLSGFALSSSSDFGLYLQMGSFGDQNAMVDFVQWGSSGNGRESVAAGKGIWTAGDFLTGTGPYVYTGNGTDNGVGFWAASTPKVRISWVDPGTDQIQLENYGTASVDISSYRLCSEFNYTSDLNGVNILAGSLNLAPGDTVRFDGWAITDAAADLGLYKAAGAFSDTSAMLDFVQWGGAGIGRESVADSKGIWNAGDFINGSAPFQYTGNGFQNGLSFWASSPSPSPQGSIRITYVNPLTDIIHITNLGTQTFDISTYRLCSEFNYTSDLTSAPVSIISGSLTLAPGDTVKLEGWPLTDTQADLGLYRAAGAFSDTAAMLDFVQWGAAGIGRESVAASKGIWNAGDFINGTAPYSFTGNGNDYGLSFWSTSSDPSDPQGAIRIVYVNPNSDVIHITNFGTSTFDISTYRLCSEFSYTSDLTSAPVSIISGSLTLAPGDTVKLEGWPLTDAAADLGLYRAAGAFSDTAAMLDFLQWGAAGIGRESVAASKGIWNAGDFIDGNAPFSFTGTGSDYGLSFWQVSTGLFEDLSRQQFIQAYPVPASQSVHVELDLPQQAIPTISASLMDPSGREVRRIGLLTDSAIRIERQTLSDGLYFLVLRQSDRTLAVQKIAFQR